MPAAHSGFAAAAGTRIIPANVYLLGSASPVERFFGKMENVFDFKSGTKTAKMVKSHHNVGELSKDLKYGLVEPLKQLFRVKSASPTP